MMMNNLVTGCRCCIILLLLAFQWVAHAQKLVPLHTARIQGQDKYTAFPFYEDFSEVLGLPDTTKWEVGSGVYVNYTYGIQAPTIGVATFDGLDSAGTPYSFGAPSDLGLADVLTSKCIDLSGFTISDELQLSFYWQARGWGEQPNSDDSLILEFKNTQGEWVRQWGISADTITSFDEDTVTVNSNDFLHDEFQFRFLNFGRLSGPYDTWNIDYIYFNRKADADSPNTGIVRDLGFSHTPPHLLQGYTHVPWDVFQVWQNTMDTLRVPLTNIRSSGVGDNTTHLFSTKIYADGNLISENTEPAISENRSGLASSNGTIFIFEGETIEVKAPVSLDLTGVPTEAAVRLEHSFFLFENAEDLNAVDSKQNDTIRVVTDLDQTFAYDDGSAELGWGVNKKFGRFAVEFETPIDWEVDAVDIHVARVGRRVEQGGFRVGIWQYIDTLDASNDVVLAPLKYYPISYTDSINEFERFELESRVNVPAGKFYVVFEQLTDDLLPIGFDVQTDHKEKLFINLGGTRWSQNNQFIGSLMVRPVQEKPLVTGIEEEELATSINVYPNPTNDRVYWKAGMHFEQVVLVNALGQKMAVTADTNSNSFNLSNMPAGMYFLQFYYQNKILTRKLLRK